MIRTLALLVAMLVAAPAAAAPGAVAAPHPARVVVDAGHGGQSMGALGAYGLYEKYVTLAIALRLGRLLEADPAVAVFYTRKDDVFVDLKDRPALANAVDADVFVSIHANASPATEAFGIETWYLGSGGKDREADELAARENAAAASPLPESDEDPAVAGILGDLARVATVNGSAQLAETIQRALLAAFPETVSRDVRQARFAVLRYARMPAVVVEVGFLTHADEGRNLMLTPYQDRLAVAIHDAVRTYLKATAQGRIKGVR
jgi:N-acetylmuramoyl-L-alanine amidase